MKKDFSSGLILFGLEKLFLPLKKLQPLLQLADIFVVIGTSMVVYPAAGLIDYVPKSTPVFLIDPNDVAVPIYRHIHFIKEKAGAGVALLKEKLLNESPDMTKLMKQFLLLAILIPG